MQIKWRHNKVTKINKVHWKLNLSQQFDHDGKNL